MMKIIPASAVKQNNSYLGNKFKHHNEYTNCCFIYIIGLGLGLNDSALHVSNFYSWFEFKDSCIEC